MNGPRILIQDPYDPRIEMYRLMDRKEKIDRYCIADHEKTVQRLFQSDWEILSVLGTKDLLDKNWEEIGKRNNKISVYEMEKEILDQTIGYRIHKGLLAIGKIPQSKNWDLISGNIVLLNQIADSENTGSIIRTSVGMGISNLATDQKSSSAFLRRSVRVSMGNIFFQNIYDRIDLKELISVLKSKGYQIYGLSLPDEKYQAQFSFYSETKFSDKFALILGNEANGIQSDIKELVDEFILIPMPKKVDSLNVSHALAVILGMVHAQNLKTPKLDSNSFAN
jgi:tRNA G18 (ribose-2'-O)-methylase SpoU